MKKLYSLLWSTFTCLLLLTQAGCKKINQLLDESPSPSIFNPTTLEEFLSLLQDNQIMNRTSALGDISSDNYYLPYSFWQTLPSLQQNAYIWADDFYGSQTNIEDWRIPYAQVLNANIVLKGLENIDTTSFTSSTWRKVKGAALFFRSHAFFQVANLFCPHYDSTVVHQKYGIPLRLTPSIDRSEKRSTIAQTYDQILGDLKEAAELLGPYDRTRINQPCKPAAYALLARIYLSINNYPLALAYSTLCLRAYSPLIDYNSLNLAINNPFKDPNPEILFHSELSPTTTLFKGILSPNTIIDSVLFRSYDTNDLRKKAFFFINSSGQPNSKNSYTGTIYHFSGISTNEIWLIKAECEARSGNIPAAIKDLDTLLIHRWKSKLFTPTKETNKQKLLDLILRERRKELPFRGLRWSDLRRLNKEGYNYTLFRKLNGNSYSLPPNDKRYVLPIPYDVIAMSGMEQNPR
jgi:hypothetical protein